MGNVEGRELFLNVCDVVVCDGFVGNVVLKVTEGTATLLFKMIKNTFKSDFLGMIVGAVRGVVCALLIVSIVNLNRIILFLLQHKIAMMPRKKDIMAPLCILRAITPLLRMWR